MPLWHNESEERPLRYEDLRIGTQQKLAVAETEIEYYESCNALIRGADVLENKGMLQYEFGKENNDR